MKTLLFIPLAILCLNVYAQDKIQLPLINNDVVYRQTIKLGDSSISSVKVNSLIKSWFRNRFENKNSHVISDSLTTTGKRFIMYVKPIADFPATYLFYTMKITAFKGGYSYEISNIGYQAPLGTYTLTSVYLPYLNSNKHRYNKHENEFIFANGQVLDIIDNLKSSINDLNTSDFKTSN